MRERLEQTIAAVEQPTFGECIYVRQRPDCLMLFMLQYCFETNILEINMYIGGGILGTILVLALIFYVVRRA